MKRVVTTMALLSLVLLPALGGCATRTVIVTRPAPPPPRVEVVPVQPGPGAVWVPGHWAWRPRWGRYVWIRGHWRYY